jgi:hypothetical protein
MIAADPYQGGATWAVLQYLLGLSALGHDVIFVEPLKRQKLQPPGTSLANSRNAAYFRDVISEFGFKGQSTLLLTGTQQTVGMEYADVRRAAARAGVLINVSGMLDDEALTVKIPIRLYLDLDPAFIQIWHANYGIDMGFARHTHFATVGQAIGRPSCPVPTCGLRWLPTLQPVVLERWTDGHPIAYPGLTTIANWRGYGSVEHNGVHYGQKAHSLREFFSLPTRTPERFLLALSIHPDEVTDLKALRENRWELLDPGKIAATPSQYQRFVQGSKAEFGIAKSGYVRSRSGWFSDRSAAYLASGRPVLAQDTGFAEWLPTGKGLFSFASMEDVLRAIDSLNTDYEHEAREARAIAQEFFDSRRVLTRLLDRIGA